MAKVYDALRRAEEERKRLIGDDATRSAPLEMEPIGPAVERADRKPFFKRHQLGSDLGIPSNLFVKCRQRCLSLLTDR